MPIANRAEFDQRVQEAIVVIDDVIRKYGGEEVLISIRNQLRAIVSWTAGGKNLTQPQKDRLTMGIRAQRELKGDEPKASDLINEIHGYILVDMPTEGVTPPRPRKPNTAEQALAATPGVEPAQIEARKRLARWYLESFGHRAAPTDGVYRVRRMNHVEIARHLRCIDYAQPVFMGPPPRAPLQLAQLRAPGQRRGALFVVQGTPPEGAGESAETIDWPHDDQPICKKREDAYDTEPELSYLRFFAVHTSDRWQNVPVEIAKAGHPVYFVPVAVHALHPQLRIV